MTASWWFVDLKRASEPVMSAAGKGVGQPYVVMRRGDVIPSIVYRPSTQRYVIAHSSLYPTMRRTLLLILAFTLAGTQASSWFGSETPRSLHLVLYAPLLITHYPTQSTRSGRLRISKIGLRITISTSRHRTPGISW
jgi:hypothetical protein